MIRPATLDDIQTVVQLGQRMHAESPHFSRLRYSPAKVAALLDHLVRSDDGFLWMIEIRGERVGMMLAMAVPHWCSEDKVASELALYVEPQHRGTTWSFRLIRRFLAWALERGVVFTLAGVTTGLFTEKTARLYEAAGMRRFGVLLEA